MKQISAPLLLVLAPDGGRFLFLFHFGYINSIWANVFSFLKFLMKGRGE
ncbi:hypothetical protein GBL_1369 [Geobacillus kaustophilus GBlys]|uniref:Uncharacterized protein n=1 Tax=Geobacillus kaustophilus GBlys TaxID=1337888 RepID=U2X3I4_GEOKU|nr:hypothetical protein GBL_1369 [Geobacillus kaustophilus GBlys]GAJ59630.1 hypothetical protein B23_2855 [Geobacillus thermoleovorans B23]